MTTSHNPPHWGLGLLLDFSGLLDFLSEMSEYPLGKHPVNDSERFFGKICLFNNYHYVSYLKRLLFSAKPPASAKLRFIFGVLRYYFLEAPAGRNIAKLGRRLAAVTWIFKRLA